MSTLGQRGASMLNRLLWGAMQSDLVTFSKQQADDSFTAYANVPAIRMHEYHGYIQTREGGWLPAVKKNWHLELSGMPAGVEVEKGDRIQDAAGVVWLIEAADVIAFQGQVRCVCYRAVQ